MATTLNALLGKDLPRGGAEIPDKKPEGNFPELLRSAFQKAIGRLCEIGGGLHESREKDPGFLEKATERAWPDEVNQGRVNEDAYSHAARIFRDLGANSLPSDDDGCLDALFALAFNDKEIQKEFKGSEIRRATMAAQTMEEMLPMAGRDRKMIKVLAVGDFDLPDFARPTIDEIAEVAGENTRKIFGKRGYRYDLAAKGDKEARLDLMNYLQKWYGLPADIDLEKVANFNMGLIPGGMFGLRLLADSSYEMARDQGKKLIFAQGDNSFGTWFSIIKDVSDLGRRAEIETFETAQESGLHLTGDIVKDYYGRYSAGSEQNNDLHNFYLTPSENPSGTTMSAQQILQTCTEICQFFPDAHIILDVTYVRMYRQEESAALLKAILENPALRSCITIVDSFSKTHGIPGVRAGWYITFNDERYKLIQNRNMTFGAGHSPYINGWVSAICNATPEQQGVIQSMHDFSAWQRWALHNHLIGSGKFSDLFDDNQSHIDLEDMSKSGNLYLFLKLRPGVSAKDVGLATKCFGVETDLKSGKYIRYAVGVAKEMLKF